MRTINTRHRKTAGTHGVLEEIGKDLRADFQMQFIGYLPGYDDPVGSHRIGKRRQFPLFHVGFQERRIEFRPHAMQKNTFEIGIRLEYSLLIAETLHMRHPFHVPDLLHQSRGHRNRLRGICRDRRIVLNLYMRTESDDFRTDFLFEAQHHAHRNNHHGQTDSHSGRSYQYGRTRYFFHIAVLTEQLSGYKQIEIHSSCRLILPHGRDMPPMLCATRKGHVSDLLSSTRKLCAPRSYLNRA